MVSVSDIRMSTISTSLTTGGTSDRTNTFTSPQVGNIFYNTDTSNVEIYHQDPSNNAAWRDLVVNNREIVDISGEIKVGSINVEVSNDDVSGSVFMGEFNSQRSRKYQHIRTPFLHILDDMHIGYNYPGTDFYHWNAGYNPAYWKNHILRGTGNEHTSGNTNDGIFFVQKKRGYELILRDIMVFYF